MRAKLYKFLSIFGYEPVLSDETGFVLPENKVLFKRALKKYLIWMLFTAISAGSFEFAMYIIAMFFYLYDGNYGWLGAYRHSLEISTYIFWALMIVPIIAIIAIHIHMYRKIKADDSRMGLWHCLLFLFISLLATAPSLCFAAMFFFP